MKALVVALLCTLALTGCRRGPAPAYPVPQDPLPEDTDLAPYLETRSSPDVADAGEADAPPPSDVTPKR